MTSLGVKGRYPELLLTKKDYDKNNRGEKAEVNDTKYPENDVF